ncbi:MAG: hypothetical protein C5S48_03070 [Candidatus Methanogaster sp.]|nr:MAG: hypothetical protein C5S48_03070 [ANME-2 cluster archaeon]
MWKNDLFMPRSEFGVVVGWRMSLLCGVRWVFIDCGQGKSGRKETWRAIEKWESINLLKNQ